MPRNFNRISFDMFRSWLLSQGFCVLAAGLSIVYLDRQIANFAHHFGAERDFLKNDMFRVPILQGLGVTPLLWGALFSKTRHGTKIGMHRKEPLAETEKQPALWRQNVS
jgi:hypothetical protein